MNREDLSTLRVVLICVFAYWLVSFITRDQRVFGGESLLLITAIIVYLWNRLGIGRAQ